jgi:D-psicose/D-tagatose/L-ribulose 3-epimerase
VKLSCHEMMLGDRPLAEKFSLAREGGFDGLDLRGDLLHDQVAAAARLVQDTGLPVPTVYGRLHPSLVAKTLAERAAALAVVRDRLRDAEQVGAHQLIVVPLFGATQITIQRGGGNEELEEALLLILLDELADEARQRGVAIVLEPLNRNQTHLLTSPRKAAQLTRRLGDAIGTMVDTYHMDVEDQDSADEIEGAFDQLRLVHLSDRERKLPGTGGLDFAPGLRKLRSRGYAGWYGFECAGPFTVPQLRESVEYMRGGLDPPT